MKFNSQSLLTTALLIVAMAVLFLVLLLTEKLLSIWHYLQQAPLWVSVLYTAVILLVTFFSVYLYWRYITPKALPQPKLKAIDETSLRSSVSQLAKNGVDIALVNQELQELDSRRTQNDFHIAIYGTVSAGKSSLIKAMLPDIDIAIEVTSATTKEITKYQYKNLKIIDLPGLDDPDDTDSSAETLALEEISRAHVLVFITDADLTQTQMQVLKMLADNHKPMVIGLNKSDRYSTSEQTQILQALQTKTQNKYPVVLISTGGEETVMLQDANGLQHKHLQKRQSHIQPLIMAIEQVVAENPDALNRFRDASILLLAQNKLHQAEAEFNQNRAENIIQDYTKKAVFGAMASVAPGSDLVIQGTLATKMVQSLCALYAISPKQMEIDAVIRLTGGKLKTTISLVLAVAGNALKAFPGIGTAVGGITHAVSYGMIFNALGHAVLDSIASLGVLDAQATQQKFEENLLGSTQNLAKDLAKMALKIEK